MNFGLKTKNIDSGDFIFEGLMSFLKKSDFIQVIANTPLISIDLIVENEQGDILLGKRNNRPAQGFWFVPGGRILKNELLDDAFARLTLSELGKSFKKKEARLLDVFEHLYDDCVFGDEVSTHYVVLGFHLDIKDIDFKLPETQHSEFCWWKKEKIKDTSMTHENTRAYMNYL